MERDQVTNFDYFGARSLSLNIGRFTSPDGSAFADPSNPQSWNPYLFVLNNPLTFVDPSGHDACDPSAQGSGGATFYTGVCQQLPSFFSDQPWFFENGLGPFNDWFFQQSPPTTPGGQKTVNAGPASCSANGGLLIGASATSHIPTAAAGARAGAAIATLLGGPEAGPFGAIVGGLIGGMFGIGGNVEYVPSTRTLYAGPSVAFSPSYKGGFGVNLGFFNVPTGQNPNAVANGLSGSLTVQGRPLFGGDILKSAGQAPVAGYSVGTRTYVPALQGSYSKCLSGCGCQ